VAQKRLDGKIWYFGPQNQQRTHHKVGTARPTTAIHTAIYAEGACPYTHRATHNRHTECVRRPWWSFGSRRARIVYRGSLVRFVPSVWYKRQKTADVRAQPCSQAPITLSSGGASSLIVIVNVAWMCSNLSRLGGAVCLSTAY
jgi:hypothetical protein